MFWCFDIINVSLPYAYLQKGKPIVFQLPDICKLLQKPQLVMNGWYVEIRDSISQIIPEESSYKYQIINCGQVTENIFQFIKSNKDDNHNTFDSSMLCNVCKSTDTVPDLWRNSV